jgi:ATP-dependent DNA helicase 2 subunit 2
MGMCLQLSAVISYSHELDSEPAEYAPIDETFSPIIHRINQVVKYRAIHPKDPLPLPYDVLTQFSHPPEELVDKSRGTLEKLIKACDVKKGLFSDIYVIPYAGC